MRNHPTPPASACVGRASELERALGHLGEADFLALTGPPGIGKSTLLMALLQAQSTHTSVVLDLTAFQQPHDALLAIMAALDIPLPPQGPPPEEDALHASIAQALSARAATLLALDNAEHLLQVVNALHAAMRKEGAKAALVVASRRVPEGAKNISLPPLDPESHPEELLAFFMAHLPPHARVDPKDPGTREALLASAALLEGVPLALALAAARLDLFKPEQLQRMLQNERSRHATLSPLHTALRWSWELLDAPQQEVLMRCSISHDGFAMEDLERALADHLDPLSGLQELARHSLAHIEDLGETFRGRLLESVRAFALQESRRDPVAHQARQSTHARSLSARCARIHEVALGLYWRSEINPLLRERANLEAAFEHACAHLMAEEPLCALSLSFGLHLFYRRRADVRAMERVARAFEEACCAHEVSFTGDHEAARLLIFTKIQGTKWVVKESDELYQDAMESAASPTWKLVARVASCHHLIQASPDEAAEEIEATVEFARDVGDVLHLIEMLILRASTLTHQRHMSQALATLSEAVELATQHDSTRQLGRAKLYEGFALQHMREHSRAEEKLLEAARIFRGLGDLLSLSHTLHVIAWYSVDASRMELAQQALDELLEIAHTHSLHWIKGMAQFLSGLVHLDEQRFALALVSLERAIYHLSVQGVDRVAAGALLYKSMAQELVGEPQAAWATFEQGLELAQGVSAPMARAQYLGAHASWLARKGELEQAQARLDEAAQIHEQLPEDHLIPAMLQLYQCHVDLRRYEDAKGASKARKTQKLLDDIITRLSLLLAPQTPGALPALKSGIEARMAWMMLERRLPDEILQRFDTGRLDPNAESLLVDTRSRAFRPPGAFAWVDMSRRETPFRLLEALLTHRQNHPGDPIGPDLLFEQVWPDETIQFEAAQNRLYVTLSALRKEGMKQVILNVEGGYLISDEVRLIEV